MEWNHRVGELYQETFNWLIPGRWGYSIEEPVQCLLREEKPSKSSRIGEYRRIEQRQEKPREMAEKP